MSSATWLNGATISRARRAAGRVRRRLRRFLPPRTSPERIVFSGSHKSWEDALKVSAGYDSPSILTRVRQSARLVRDGKAVFERDGVTFQHAEHRWPLLACLWRIAAQRQQQLHILDFGGSLGSTYFQCRPLLTELSKLHWSVVEQSHYVECGRAEFETQELRFFHRADEALAMGRPDVLLISGVLQALPEPYRALDELLALQIENVVFDRTPLLDGEADRLTIESVPPEILGHRSSCPAWFFSRARLENVMARDHERVVEFKALDEDASLEAGRIGRFVGQHWRRRAAGGGGARQVLLTREIPGAPLPGRLPPLRVGIVLGRQQEEAGGGFVYEESIFSALQGHIAGSPHQFAVVVPEGCRRRAAGNLDVLELPPGVVPALQPSWSKQVATEFLRAHGIDFLIHLNPFIVLFSDVPYLAVVWDLQHRLQPHFPEVSAGPEFDVRERHFAAVLPRATFILTGTQTGRKQVEDLFSIPRERIIVSPMPTPLDALQHRSERGGDLLRRYGIDRSFLFYPAQFWAHKNHVTLLHALDLLRRQHQQRPLLIFSGSDYGNLSHVLSCAKTLGLDEQVRHLGFISRADILDLYSAASALVFPSLFGPDNIPPLEAFALGCPVILGNTEGASEYVGNAALLVEPLDPEAWATAISLVLSDEATRAELVRAGRQRASLFTTRDSATLILSLVDRFAALKGLWAGR